MPGLALAPNRRRVASQTMARQYRALISVPITANDDEDAMEIGARHAHTLAHPDNPTAVAGHLEFLGEVGGDIMEVARVVWADPSFQRQLSPDWKP
jgi:hypothetical protein